MSRPANGRSYDSPRAQDRRTKDARTNRKEREEKQTDFDQKDASIP